MEEIVIPQRKARKFIGEEILLASWEEVQPLYENLVIRPIDSAQDLRQWFIDRSELESYLSENMAWRYIKMTCDTVSEENQKNYQFFVEEIQPQLSAYNDQLNKKALESPYLGALEDKGFDITIRSMKKAVEIFREENIPLETLVQTKQAEYQSVVAAMTVTINGQVMALPKAGDLLQSPDRAVREDAWTRISERRYQNHEQLDSLFNELRDLRHQIATNAGFANFRDYMFAAMGRFDYTPQDCFNFHEAVAETVMPLVDKMAKDRKAKLKVDELRPWDLKVDTDGKPALKPFTDGESLLDKTVQCFNQIDARFANYIRIMRTMGHFDVEARVGKAPGGYNYPLEEIGVPFIFMNATSSLRDVVTMVHEGGHAIHSFEIRDLPLNTFRNTPSEVAELASMSMELISMEHWGAFFDNEEDLKRAKVEHLEDILEVLPWIATIDKFQHWIYENPTHSIDERQEAWLKIFELFSDSVTNWKGFERFKKYVWQRQLHVFEIPFYYIEYGMAQLGAISVWRNYKKDSAKGLEGYLNALRLGYTAPIGKIYEAANVKFDFSKEYITELMAFVESELEQLR